MQKLFIFYNFLLVTLMCAVGFLSATSYPEILSAILFFPVALYFGLLLVPQKSKALVLPEAKELKPEPAKLKTTHDHITEPLKSAPLLTTNTTQPTTKFDPDRRAFLKIIGSAGITLFLFSIFTKRAHGAFFGSNPGPGTVSIKDSSGNVIDPAAATPTDGYKISDIDSNSPAYYGFVDKTGRWFIMKEGTSSDYRYSKGSTLYSTNWTNRTSLTYDYFDVIF